MAKLLPPIREFIKRLPSLRPVAITYTWHALGVGLLWWLLLPFNSACLAWLVLNLAGRDAAILYGLINRRQF